MTNSPAMPIDAERTLEMTRLYRAPKELVLRMWSDPNLITNWWGPVGFSTTTERMDFRPGGEWVSTMNAPTGEQYLNFHRYIETGPDRIVSDHSSDGGKTFDFRFEIDLEEVEPGRTRMTFRQVHPSAELLQAKMKFGIVQGMADTLTRLDALLGNTQAAENPFRLHLSVPSDTEILMVRSFRAPRALVFEAMTNAEHIRQWQSPYRYRFTECSFDARIGGKWSMTQEGGAGERYKFRGEILELNPPERFVGTFEYLGTQSSKQTNTVTLDEVDGITRVTILSSFDSKSERDGMLEGGMEWGAGQSYDRLETMLLIGYPDSRNPRFSLSRLFKAPQELVWKAWTEADRLSHWWGPKGCQIRVAHLDVQSGGTFHYAMDAGERGTMWGRFIYRDVNPTSELTFVNSFSDAQGGLTRAPFSDLWPLEVLNVLTLSPESGGTRLHLEATPLSAEPAELKQFVEWFDSLTQGFGGTFDQLEEYLGESA